PQVVTTNEFTNFMKANDAILKNMQTNLTSLTNLNLELKNMFGQFMKMNTASSSGLGALPGNTITNPKEDLKGITTRSGTAYPGPTIPTTTSSSSLVVERETEETKDMMHPTNNGSTEDVQPPVVPTESPILNSEPVNSPIIEPVASPKFPEKLGDPGKFLISCDFLRMAECLALADLDASINLMPLSVWNKLSLPDLSPMCMTLDVFVKVGTFHFPADFVVVDFDADPPNYNDMTANQIDVIDMACEEYSQEVLGFSDMIASGNPTPYYDQIVSTTSSTLTPFGNSDFLLEEVDAFLALEDDPTSSEVDQSYLDSKGDILLLEAFPNDDTSLPPPNQGNYLPEVRKELKICEAKSDKSLIDEPSKVELKYLPPHLEYTFLEGDDKLPDIIVKDLSVEEKTALITVLKSHKRAIAWKLSDIKATRKDHFPLPFMDQMLERLARNQYNYFLDGFSGYFQIPIDLKYQENTTFSYPFGLCNAPGMFQRCMMAIFHDMIEKTMEVFMDDFSIFENSFQARLSHLEKMLKRCEDTNLCLNWEKSHFMVKEGIVLGHKIFKEGIEVDKAKVDVIAKLPHPTTVKGIRSFLGHAGFYQRFIQDFSKIARPMTRLLEKDTPFLFSKECVEAFQTLKRKLTEAPILIAPG
nr:reverse transcriptase domain-containing protein [Tanacetum cinerariifolium]GFA39138.1 reverse transcriptase domain-containing protein [Tanacetum cinerariifolium]